MKSAIIGLGFGDEGKGITTDYLCQQALKDNRTPVVVRYSGGQQAGHTVCIDDHKHVFSNFGSGTLRGIPTLWKDTCTFDPVGCINELDLLIQNEISPTLYVEPNTPVTTPYDKYANQTDEQNCKHGTCGTGVGKTWQREEDHYHLHFSDLFNDTILEIKMNQIRLYYGVPAIDLYPFYEAVEQIRDTGYIKVADKYWNYQHQVRTGKNIDSYIFESSQGLLLDQEIGFFPHVTRSHLGLKNLYKEGLDHVYLVTRAYQTRHGNGPMTNTELPFEIAEDTRETNITNEYQGEFRRSMLDLDLLKYSVYKSNTEGIPQTLVITCLDHLKEFKFTHRREVVECSDYFNFVNEISNRLLINNILISSTPYSKNILNLSQIKV